MSVSTMLETLQTQIKAKTAELPTLYNQLGLPATALTDELNSLQERLTSCVDEVVNGRREEVREWMERCNVVEERIQSLLKATGSTSLIGDSSSLDSVLPNRLEALSTHQEKLQQLYVTKLEQRTSLCNRITDLARILGDDYLPISTVQDCSTNQLEDVSPDCLSKLERDLVRAKSEVTKRRAALVQTFDHLAWLHSELGLELPSDPFSDGRTSTSRSGDPCLSVFECFVASGPESLSQVEPSTELIAWTQTRVSELEAVKANRELQIQIIYDQLEPLWKRLGISDKDVDEFVDSWRGSTDSVIEAYEAELERMLELKRSTMSTFIANARAEIEEVWDELMYDESARRVFEAYFDEEHTEELLAQHEIELERLRTELKGKFRILVAVKKYKEICEEEKELATAATDQSRLLGRGPRDPGRLLREEKMRKRVTKEKPRLEQDLLASICQWEQEQETLFCVDGVRFLDILSENVNKSNGEKESKKRGRANTGPSRATTPGPPHLSQQTHSTSKSSIKKAKVENGITNQHAIRNRSVTPTPINAYYGVSGRQILGSRNGLLNMATPTPFCNAAPGGKTPSSTLPRLKSGLPVPHLVPTPSLNGLHNISGIPMHSHSEQAYGKLGFGFPSTMRGPGGPVRSISSSSMVTSTTSRVISHTNQRRESFRPRSSVGDKMGQSQRVNEERTRFTGGSNGLLLEEE